MSTFENRKIAPHCRIASGVWGDAALSSLFSCSYVYPNFFRGMNYQNTFSCTKCRSSFIRHLIYHALFCIFRVQMAFRDSGVTRALIGGGGGGCIFIYSCSARRISFEIKFISKEIRRAEHEYMNIHPPN